MIHDKRRAVLHRTVTTIDRLLWLCRLIPFEGTVTIQAHLDIFAERFLLTEDCQYFFRIWIATAGSLALEKQLRKCIIPQGIS